jgi:putative heme iron utilization protein
MNDRATAHQSARSDAKRLLRLARTGALATLDASGPLTTLIGVASDWDGAPLFLMSELARHTKNLTSNPRASLLLTSEGGRGDPLNQPRITLNGVVRQRRGGDGRERYVRRNPKAKLYANFTDFSVRRLDIETVHFNGGFGRADPLAAEDILTQGDASALAAAEAELLQRTVALGDATLAKLAGGGSSRRAWRAVGIDPDGLDLSRGGEAARADLPHAAFDPEAWWQALQGQFA